MLVLIMENLQNNVLYRMFSVVRSRGPLKYTGVTTPLWLWCHHKKYLSKKSGTLERSFCNTNFFCHRNEYKPTHYRKYTKIRKITHHPDTLHTDNFLYIF